VPGWLLGRALGRLLGCPWLACFAYFVFLFFLFQQ
jgi:hypothetical protein